MKASDQVKTGAAVAFVAILSGVLIGNYTPNANEGKTTIAGDPGAGAKCLFTTALASPQALALFGLSADGGHQYVYARVCGQPSDGGMPSLPAGIEALDFGQTEEDYDGGPIFSAVLPGRDEWPCACSTGALCNMLDNNGVWRSATPGITLEAGKWSGSGCYPKSCVELAGVSSWPSACPQ